MDRMLVKTDLILKKVDEEKAKGTRYLVIAYDVPSENIQSLEPKIKRQLKTARLTFSRVMSLYGFQINNSVYAVHVDRIPTILDRLTEIYAQIPEHLSNKIDLALIGNAYEDTLKELIENYVKKQINRIRDDLDLIDAKLTDLKENSEDIDEKQLKQIKSKLHTFRFKLDCLHGRIYDLSNLGVRVNNYMAKWTALESLRNNLLREIGFLSE